MGSTATRVIIISEKTIFFFFFLYSLLARFSQSNVLNSPPVGGMISTIKTVIGRRLAFTSSRLNPPDLLPTRESQCDLWSPAAPFDLFIQRVTVAQCTQRSNTLLFLLLLLLFFLDQNTKRRCAVLTSRGRGYTMHIFERTKTTTNTHDCTDDYFSVVRDGRECTEGDVG